MTLKCEVYFRSLLQENMNWLNAQFKIWFNSKNNTDFLIKFKQSWRDIK
jgi:hypothetical protein